MNTPENNSAAVRTRRKSQSGMVFAMTMTVLFVIFCAAVIGTLALRPGSSSAGNGLFNLADNARQASVADLNQSLAYNLAESGVMYTVQWLSQQNPPPSNPSSPNLPYAPQFWNGVLDTSTTPNRESITMPVSGASDTGKFAVLVYPNIDSINQTQKKYLIESIGAYRGVQEVVQAYVEQDSFGKYAYFTDNSPPNAIWEPGLTSFNGPVHSNDTNGNQRYMCWSSADNTNPMFNYGGAGAYTTSAPSIQWVKDFQSFTPPATNNDWIHIAAGGASTVQAGVASIPMPASSSTEQTAALGGAAAPTGSTPSVTIASSGGSTAGGIYIHGDSTQMTLTTDSTGTKQTIEDDQQQVSNGTYQGSNYTATTYYKTYVTINPSSNTTATYTTNDTQVLYQGNNYDFGTNNSGTTTLNGTTNGVIYSDGNFGHQETSGDANYDSYPDTSTAYNNNGADHGQDMTGGVSGTVADNYYNSGGQLVHTSGITVATSTSSNLNIDGNLTTFTPVTSSNYTKNAGTLGLVSKTLEVTTNDQNGNAITNCTVMASVVAYDTMDAANLTKRQTGTFTLVGGYIAENGGVFGLVNLQNNTVTNGLSQHFNYDVRMANNPPPFFPTTGTTYSILSWQRVTAPIG